MSGLARHLFRKVLLPSLFGVLVAVVTYAVMVRVVPPTFVVPEDPRNEQPPARDSFAAVWQEHGSRCWRMSDKPKADLPSAAIVVLNDPMFDGKVLYVDLYHDVDEAFSDALWQAGIDGGEHSTRFTTLALCVKKGGQ